MRARAARVFPCHPTCSFTLYTRAQTEFVRLYGIAWTKGGRQVGLFRFSCSKAFTCSPPLTPVLCRSDADCDKTDSMPRRASHLLRA